ncbi:MAG TPA: hypothetical protein VEA16_08710 [Vicinamibacterales bacterium]|nr:hypothetical protein [Vicinamibacterales bacterium]
MVDAGIGRLLISSLHQGIADVSPNRLDFYENWLSPAGMRDGRIGLAPLGAVLSFLHREEAPANEQIVERAGRYAADWTFADLSGFRRWYLRRLPMRLRSRAALGLGKKLILATVRQSKVKTQLTGTRAAIDINSALFDQLRDPATIPMRAFYASAIERMLQHCAVDADVSVTNDQPGAWSLAIVVRGPRQLEAVESER